jgi:hypothetical protein
MSQLTDYGFRVRRTTHDILALGGRETRRLDYGACAAARCRSSYRPVASSRLGLSLDRDESDFDSLVEAGRDSLEHG